MIYGSSLFFLFGKEFKTYSSRSNFGLLSILPSLVHFGEKSTYANRDTLDASSYEGGSGTSGRTTGLWKPPVLVAGTRLSRAGMKSVASCTSEMGSSSFSLSLSSAEKNLPQIYNDNHDNHDNVVNQIVIITVITYHCGPLDSVNVSLSNSIVCLMITNHC